MSEVDDLIESIQSTEAQNLYSSVAPGRLSQICISKTSELAKATHIVRDTGFKRFIPSIILRVLVACLIISLWVIVFLNTDRNTDQVKLIFFLLVVALATVRQAFFWGADKNRNFSMLIDREGIEIGKTQYKWSEIKETAILYLPVRRYGSNFLVILFKDHTYEKFDLSNFWSFEGFKKTISKYIEYFKPVI